MAELSGGEALDAPLDVLAGWYRSGRADPEAVVRECHERLERRGQALGAVTEILDRDLAEARLRTDELVAGRDRGPLHGVPVVVKELIDVAGCRRSAGTHVRPDGWGDPVDADAGVVATLREAGAVIVARARTHEFAWGITTRHPDGTGAINPLDATRVAGGSSGGVGALVAAGCAPVGIGTDTGGSVRIPAAFCGLVGWKPEHGRIPIGGVVPLARSFDTLGVLTRTVEDAVVVDRVVQGGLAAASARSDGLGDRPPSRRGVLASGRPLRPDRELGVARLDDPSLPTVEAECTEALDRVSAAIGLTKTLRAGPGPDQLPRAADLTAAYAVLQRFEALPVHRDELRTWPAQAAAYGDDVAGRLREAEALDGTEVERARRFRREARAGYRRVFGAESVDAVILPSAAGGPSTVADPDVVEVDGRVIPLRDAVMPFTVLANVTGWPALVVPVGRPRGGIPVSVQVIARPDAVRLLPELATRIRRASG